MTSDFPEFVLPGKPGELSAPACGDLPGSGLQLNRSVTSPQFFDVSGPQTLVMGTEGGPVEVWTYPFKALRRLDFSIDLGDGRIPLADHCTGFTIRPEAAVAEYQTGSTTIRQTIVASASSAAALFAFEVNGGEEAAIFAEFESDLLLMWPAERVEQDVHYGTDGASSALVARAAESKDAAVAGWAGGEKVQASVGETPLFEQAVRLAGPEGRALFVVTGSTEGHLPARDEFLRAASDYRRVYEEAVAYQSDLMSRTVGFECSSPELTEAYAWAVVATDKCLKRSPGMGRGFVAGYNLSGTGGRPGFGWYFGRDSSWTGFAANAYADFDAVRDNIRLLAKYQIPDGPHRGKIYHEISAAHDRLDEGAYAFPAGDSTPFFVVDVADLYEWTADLDFVQEMWPHVRAAMEWCYRMDVDGDLLIDNPPAGHQWYDYGEKNMIDLVAIWVRALEGAAALGEAVGDSDVTRWRNDAARVIAALNTEFWNEADGYLFDRKLPDGSMIALTTANPTIPLLWNLIEPGKAAQAVERLAASDMTVEWGLRTNSDKDEIYKPSGYHEGTVWPLVTGWGSLAALANGRPDLGWSYLKANADLTRDFCLGYITEVLDGGERTPGGCPHQAWSEAMIILPIVQGIFGVRPDCPAGCLTVAPALPEELDHATLRRLRVGDHLVDVTLRRIPDGLAVEIDSGSEDLSVSLSPLAAAGRSLESVEIDGSAADLSCVSLIPCGSGHRCALQQTLRGRHSVAFRWTPGEAGC